MIGADEVRQIQSAARFGSTRAQVLLGQLCVDGNGVPQSRAEGRRWFQKAADAGSVEGINMVGRCHEFGWGGPVDLAAAAACYRTAAERSYDWAQFNLASLLHDGKGVPQDRREACAWFVRAARQGHPKAANMLGHYREEGWLHPRRPDKAGRWYARAAKGGDFRGQFNLARFLFVAGQREPALIWLDLAVRGGIPDFWREIASHLTSHPDPALRRYGERARMLASSGSAGASSQPPPKAR
ncbi:tetratricopeptide repeat protein [Geminicoccus flavidas]|uniref:tetratricopeptide repeat protein n=1 Tax=Geminicoccus flavidas TaxID=2506407 RepID=UPI00135BB04A|nr:tetratricopeptide repeat protein [Geminicoccus flavidas]